MFKVRKNLQVPKQISLAIHSLFEQDMDRILCAGVLNTWVVKILRRRIML